MSKAPKIDPQTQARILVEALPHMQRYDEEIVVVKYGGHAMGQEQMARDFARDIVLLEQTDVARKVTDRKSTRLNSSHLGISYAVFCLKKKKKRQQKKNMKHRNTYQYKTRLYY